MAIKYLYLDDEMRDSLSSYTDAVCRESSDLEIETEHPRVFNQDLDAFYTKLQDYDGLILDWRLDQIPGEDGQSAHFRAGMLAQELRTRTTEDTLTGIPIVLWSTDEKLGGSYIGDFTSHDLFDAKHLKGDVSRNPKQVAEDLISLSNGYKNLNDFRADKATILQNALGLDSQNFQMLDVRLVDYFAGYKQVAPVHEYARFMLNQCIRRPGVLIDEQLLAAKLGIDIEKSDDWQTFCENSLDSCKYTGVFHEAWPRWWWINVQQWWKQLGDVKPISRYLADERVSIIKENVNLKELHAAGIIEPHYSAYYDTICQHSKRPLDKLDGVMIDEPEPLSWQEHRYLSIRVALRREYNTDVRPHPLEKQRLIEIGQTMK